MITCIIAAWDICISSWQGSVSCFSNLQQFLNDILVSKKSTSIGLHQIIKLNTIKSRIQFCPKQPSLWPLWHCPYQTYWYGPHMVQLWEWCGFMNGNDMVDIWLWYGASHPISYPYEDYLLFSSIEMIRIW